MNRRQQINKILHDHIDVDKNTDYTNYKKLITAIEEWHEQQVKSVDLADVGGALPNYSDDVNTASAMNMGRTLDMGKQ